MLLRKESLEKIDVCRDFLAYVTAGPRTCLNHLYRSQLRSVSKSVCDAGKFQPFLILATLPPPPPPLPLIPYLQPSPLTPYSQFYKKGNGTAGSFSIAEQQQFPGSVLP